MAGKVALRAGVAPSALAARGYDGLARGGLGGGGLGLAGGVGGAADLGDAGVRLYGLSNSTSALQEAVNTNKISAKRARALLADKKASKEEKEKARGELDRIAKIDEAHKVAVHAVVSQLGDKSFIQGFGSNGGEEFLSYLNIGETLVAQGGPEWEKWDRSMTENLNRIQNKDGSWSGDHCITGRTFCTASALLVLMADRTPMPVASRIAEKRK